MLLLIQLQHLSKIIGTYQFRDSFSFLKAFGTKEYKFIGITRPFFCNRNLKVGPPGEKSTFLGALISRTHWDKVSHYVNIASKEGATIHCGFSADSLDLPEGFEKVPQLEIEYK